jgi:hypothetical protein
LGAVREGYLADLVLIDRGEGIDDWSIGLSSRASESEELSDLSELMLRSASHRNVRHVMVNGQWVVRDGHSSTLDESAIVAALRENLIGQRGVGGQAQLEVARAIAPAIRSFYAGWDSAGVEKR